MRYLLILFLILAFVVGCGCSNNPMVPPAYGYFGDAKDVWPALYGTANGAVDNGIFITYDQNTAAWSAPNTVDTDLLPLQWTPQRNSIGWTTAGRYNASFIEATGNDLEIWERPVGAPGDGWQDDAGAWGLLDSDATYDFLETDVETRQNWVWSMSRSNVSYYVYAINLVAVGPTLTFVLINTLTDPSYYSIVLDNNLYGVVHQAFVYDGGLRYHGYIIDEATSTGEAIDADNTYPQIIVDGEERLWIFTTQNNTLLKWTKPATPISGTWGGNVTVVYTAVILTDDYHATWMAMDDTIHVVLVDEDSVNPNATHLVYMRRTANGWVEQEILLTVDSQVMGDDDHLAWPQITVDKLGNIFVYYIFLDTFIAAGGDLQGWYLDSAVYGNPIAASWVQHVNIDQSADLVKWVVAPDSIPISADM